MTEHTDTSLHDLVTHTFATIEAKDLEAMMRVFADDAVVIDPHFPTLRMQGKAAIREGFRGAISGMRSFGYTIVNYFESENEQLCGSRDGNTPCPETRNEAKLPPSLHL